MRSPKTKDIFDLSRLQCDHGLKSYVLPHALLRFLIDEEVTGPEYHTHTVVESELGEESSSKKDATAAVGQGEKEDRGSD